MYTLLSTKVQKQKLYLQHLYGLLFTLFGFTADLMELD